jgi:hypothetical protein
LSALTVALYHTAAFYCHCSAYNAKIPVLLGTNFLSKVATNCKEHLGPHPHYVQRLSTQTTWYLALRCLSVRERQLSRNQNCVAVVRCAEPAKRTLLPNESITVKGVIDKAQPYHATCALLQPLRNVYEDLDLAPSVTFGNVLKFLLSNSISLLGGC